MGDRPRSKAVSGCQERQSRLRSSREQYGYASVVTATAAWAGPPAEHAVDWPCEVLLSGQIVHCERRRRRRADDLPRRRRASVAGTISMRSARVLLKGGTPRGPRARRRAVLDGLVRGGSRAARAERARVGDVLPQPGQPSRSTCLATQAAARPVRDAGLKTPQAGSRVAVPPPPPSWAQRPTRRESRSDRPSLVRGAAVTPGPRGQRPASSSSARGPRPWTAGAGAQALTWLCRRLNPASPL